MEILLSGFFIFLYVLIGFFLVYGMFRIVMKAGYAWEYGFLFLAPVINIVWYGIFAFDKWPIEETLKKNLNNPQQEKGTSRVVSTAGVEAKPTANFCANCGNKLLQGVKFCPNCDSKLGQEEASSTKSPRDESVAPSKDGFKNDGKCPYCDSVYTKQKLLEGPYSDKKASDFGYWYKWDSKCNKCGKEWFAMDYYHHYETHES